MFGANPFGIDPSKMDPKALMELSNLVRELPPAHLSRMQTLMHNMMAGFDVRKEMEEFERGLPPGFREKLMSVMLRNNPMSGGAAAAAAAAGPDVEEAQVLEAGPTPAQYTSAEMSVREARLTVLRAVAHGSMEPEDAITALWPNG
jgi:hypothetical protein